MWRYGAIKIGTVRLQIKISLIISTQSATFYGLLFNTMKAILDL